MERMEMSKFNYIGTASLGIGDNLDETEVTCEASNIVEATQKLHAKLMEDSAGWWLFSVEQES